MAGRAATAEVSCSRGAQSEGSSVWAYHRKRPDGEERTHVDMVSELRHVAGRSKLVVFWFPVMMLGIDALHVVEMRLRMIASGKSTLDEMFLMVMKDWCDGGSQKKNDCDFGAVIHLW